MDRIRGEVSSRLPDQIRAWFPEGVPAVTRIQGIVDNLSQEEIAAKVSGALSRVDQQKLDEFGAMLAAYGRKQGVEVPDGVEHGNPKSIGQMFARIAKSEKGVNGAIRFLTLASGGRGLAGAAMMMSPLGRGGLLGLLANPQTRSVVGPLISGLIKR